MSHHLRAAAPVTGIEVDVGEGWTVEAGHLFRMEVRMVQPDGYAACRDVWHCTQASIVSKNGSVSLIKPERCTWAFKILFEMSITISGSYDVHVDYADVATFSKRLEVTGGMYGLPHWWPSHHWRNGVCI